MSRDTWKHRVDKLLKDVENECNTLKCCGNCRNFSAWNTCTSGHQDANYVESAFRVCKHWEFDRLEIYERTLDV